MNSKQGINIIIGLLIIVFGYYAYVLLGGKQNEINNISERVNLNETSMRMSEDYVPVKWEEKGKTIWNGLGFEPGFILEIKVTEESGKYAKSVYPTKITFQENGEVEGLLNLTQNDNSAIKYNGNLMIGGDGAVNTEIKIIKKECIRPNEEKNDFTVNINFGNETYNGCIKMVN
jgi:hypothetical protein